MTGNQQREMNNQFLIRYLNPEDSSKTGLGSNKFALKKCLHLIWKYKLSLSQ